MKVKLELDPISLAVVQQALSLASINLQATQAIVQEQIREHLEKHEPGAVKTPLRAVET